MQRTTFSPRCCCKKKKLAIEAFPLAFHRQGSRTATSRTSFWPLLVVSREFRIGGSLAVSNLTVYRVSSVLHQQTIPSPRLARAAAIDESAIGLPEGKSVGEQLMTTNHRRRHR